MTQILVHIILHITVPLEGFVLCLLCKSAIERVCSVHCMQYAVMNTLYLGSLQTRRLRAVHVLQKYSLLSRFSVICIKVMMMHSMSRMEKVLPIVLCVRSAGSARRGTSTTAPPPASAAAPSSAAVCRTTPPPSEYQCPHRAALSNTHRLYLQVCVQEEEPLRDQQQDPA